MTVMSSPTTVCAGRAALGNGASLMLAIENVGYASGQTGIKSKSKWMSNRGRNGRQIEVEMDAKSRSKRTPKRGRNGSPPRSSTILVFNFCGRRPSCGPRPAGRPADAKIEKKSTKRRKVLTEKNLQISAANNKNTLLQVLKTYSLAELIPPTFRVPRPFLL